MKRTTIYSCWLRLPNLTARIVLVAVLLLASLVLSPNRAFAYCGGLSSWAGLWGAGGYTDFADSDQLTEVTGYIQGRLPDPVVNASAAWNMLSRATNRDVFAQGGWVRRAGWPTYYVFAAWKDTNGNYTEVAQYPSGETPSLSHNYGVRQMSGTTAYDFTYNFGSWINSGNLGWSPSEIVISGETHNHGDHFPGSAAPGPYVEFWGSTHTVLGLNYPNSLTMFERPSGNDVTGKTQLSGNDFYICDKRCTDG